MCGTLPYLDTLEFMLCGLLMRSLLSLSLSLSLVDLVVSSFFKYAVQFLYGLVGFALNMTWTLKPFHHLNVTMTSIAALLPSSFFVANER